MRSDRGLITLAWHKWLVVIVGLWRSTSAMVLSSTLAIRRRERMMPSARRGCSPVHASFSGLLIL